MPLDQYPVLVLIVNDIRVGCIQAEVYTSDVNAVIDILDSL